MTDRKFDVLKMSGVPSKADADRQRADRELLEMAAKAAGLTLAEHHMSTGYPWCDELRREWNPLDDDGDALRLAVKLRIRIGFRPQTYADTPMGTRCFGAIDGEDAKARTRRAIVRAAAAMAEGGEQ